MNTIFINYFHILYVFREEIDFGNVYEEEENSDKLPGHSTRKKEMYLPMEEAPRRSESATAIANIAPVKWFPLQSKFLSYDDVKVLGKKQRGKSVERPQTETVVTSFAQALRKEREAVEETHQKTVPKESKKERTKTLPAHQPSQLRFPQK